MGANRSDYQNVPNANTRFFSHPLTAGYLASTRFQPFQSLKVDCCAAEPVTIWAASSLCMILAFSDSLESSISSDNPQIRHTYRSLCWLSIEFSELHLGQVGTFHVFQRLKVGISNTRFLRKSLVSQYICFVYFTRFHHIPAFNRGFHCTCSA